MSDRPISEKNFAMMSFIAIIRVNRSAALPINWE